MSDNYDTIDSISLKISSGLTPLRTQPEYWEKGTIPWLKTEQLGEYQIYATSEKISQIAIDETSIKINPINTVSIAMYGEGHTRGNVSMLKKPMTTNQACCNIIVNENLADYRYVYYWLKNNYYQLRNLSSGIRNNLNSDDIKNFPFNYKELSEQRRIADILSFIDEKISLNNRINAELEQMAKTIYNYWFVQFDFPISAGQAASMGKPELEGKPYKASGGKMVWNEELKREVPVGWEVKQIFKELDIQYGFPFDTAYFTDDITAKPVARIRDILGNTYSAYTTQEVDEKYALKSGDLLIGMDGNFHMNFWPKNEGYLNQRSVRIRAKEKSSVSNFQAYFELAPYIKTIENRTGRTTVGHLSDSDLKDLYIFKPIENLHFKPKHQFDNLLQMIISNRNQNQELTRLRDFLLPLLMNGQVRVGENISH